MTNEKLPKRRSFLLFCGFALVFMKITVNTMDNDYNGKQVLDLSRKAQFFADSDVAHKTLPKAVPNEAFYSMIYRIIVT